MAAMEFRKAVQEDVEGIIACIKAAYADALSTISDIPDVTDGIAEDVEANRVILAEANNALLGVVVWLHKGETAMIFNLAVWPDKQGQGVARKLLELVSQKAKANGASRMELKTHRLMQETRSMYRHLGWVEIDINETKVTMSKDL